MSAFTTHIFQAKVPERFNRDFGAGRRVEGVVSREYKPAAAPRVKNVIPLVGGSWPRGSWASSVSDSPWRTVRPGQAGTVVPLPGGPGASCQAGNPFNRIAHCLAVGDTDSS